METYWAAPAAARDHVAALGRPSMVCVPVGSARIAQGGAQQHGDHEASITPIAGCQPDFGCQSIVGCTDCPAGKHSFDFRRRVYNSFVFDRWTPTPLQQKDGARRAGRLAPTCDPPTSRNERSSCRR